METKSIITSGANISYWTDSFHNISYSRLNQNEETDTLVIGGGIAGVSIAYCLARQNRKVILIEDGYIGSGETGRTTAHLVTALDDRYYNLEKLFGEKEARLVAESHAAAIDFIEKTIAHEKIECDFERLDGYLFLHPSDDPDSLNKEYEACKRAGLDVELKTRVPGMLNSDRQALMFRRQAQFHPLKYINGLCEAILRMGGKIYTETHAKKIDHTGAVTDKGHKISAKNVVVATNSPVNNMVVMHLKQYAYRTYAIGTLIKKNSMPFALWWDTGDYDLNKNVPPYHYVRVQKYDEQYDLLICGGEDHPTGLASAEAIPEENRYGLLEDWCRKNFPTGEVLFHWSGQVLEPMDSIAFIGRNPMDKDNVYIATGDSGNGMTHSTIAGMLITDLITGKENLWENIYSPARFKIFKAGDVFFREVVGGMITYLKETPKNTDEVMLSTIKKGEGKIVEIEGKKYGAYVDENDKVHLVAAECTHLKCTVNWNNDEKTWDCPCHGSRFTQDGKVINGPAISNLFYYKEEGIKELRS